MRIIRPKLRLYLAMRFLFKKFSEAGEEYYFPQLKDDPGINQINLFLTNAYNQIHSQDINSKRVHFIIGNESADLDSTISSITLAYFLNCQNKSGHEMYIPIIQVTKNDFRLRTDINFLFSRLGIKVGNLVFLEDVSLPTIKDLKFTLVDHNSPSEILSSYNEKVVGIVDHHKAENVFPQLSDLEISPVGSCATLVAAKFLSKKLPLSKGLALLLIAPIIVDTISLSLENGRTTEQDIYTAEQLTKYLDGLKKSQIFKALLVAKNDISLLTIADLLKKDSKTWIEKELSYTFCSVPLSATQLLQKESLEKLSGSLAEYTFTEGKRPDILLIMAYHTNGELFNRELIIFSSKRGLVNLLKVFLLESGSGLHAEIMTNYDLLPANILVLKHNPKISRKLLQPIISEFVNQLRF